MVSQLYNTDSESRGLHQLSPPPRYRSCYIKIAVSHE